VLGAGNLFCVLGYKFLTPTGKAPTPSRKPEKTSHSKDKDDSDDEGAGRTIPTLDVGEGKEHFKVSGVSFWWLLLTPGHVKADAWCMY
jgi:hypothetical protein